MRRRSDRTVLRLGTPALASALLASVGACGPSLEAMHESNIRFEHCYRLDMDTKIAPSHRYTCWMAWTERYAYGQTRDRREYARRRIIALESGDIERINVHEMPDRPQRIFSETGPTAGETEARTAPVPTSAHAPPPSVAPATPRAEEAAQKDTPTVDLPGASCTKTCASAYRSCQQSCANDVETCTRCREDYRSCMRRCYE